MFTPLKAPFRQGWLALTLLLLVTAPVIAQQINGHGSRTRPYTVVYKLKPENTTAARTASYNTLQQALQKVGAKGIHPKFPNARIKSAKLRNSASTDITRIYQATYSSELSFKDVQRALMATGNVAYVEPLYLREPFYSTSDPHSDSTKITAYYLKLIKAYGAWDIQKGDTNIVIGVADTGFRTDHIDLKNNIKYNYADPIDGTDNDGDGYTDNYAGWDFADGDNNVLDDTRYKSHGMGVAGVAAATPDNAIGMAGVGFRTKLLPLKVFSSRDGSFGGGYEAVVYAAEKGCKIINLSWGGEGYSQYEQDIINYVVLEKDVVVVSAAGNIKKQANYYPASYANVLSVAGSDKSDLKYKDYTWSHYVDLMAPSIDIYSTSVTNNNSYTYNWGSSFSSPMVAGAAALVRAQFPQLNALQVMERIRVTTDNINNLAGNQPYLDKIGTGRLNIKKALTQNNLAAVRCTAFTIKNNRSAQAGSTVAIEAGFLNILDPVSNLEVTLSTSSPFVTIANERLSLGSMATMATANNHTAPFQVTISPDIPINTTVAFKLSFNAGNYTDYQYFELVVNPDYHTMDANNVRITINSKGNLGFNGLNFDQGVGMQYKGSTTLLFEGGLMIGTSAARVSDNLRNANWQNDGDFTPIRSSKIYYDTPTATQEVRGLLQDIYPSASTVGVEVKHRTMAWNSVPDKDYIIQEYYIKNLTPDTLRNLSSALFADWDVGVYYQNAASWDDTRNLGYVYNTVGSQPVVGIKLLTPVAPIYYAIDNVGVAGSIAIEDGFTNAEKYAMLAGGVARTEAKGNGNGDNVSHVVGGIIPKLAPGETKVVSFAILSGDNLTALQQHADAAQQKYIQIKSGPPPVAVQDTICIGSDFTWTPTGGTNYKFYADPEKKTLLATGSAYTLKNFTENISIYATNVDSLFESAVSQASLSVPLPPAADFEAESATLHANTPVRFVNKSINGKNWRWNFGNGDISTDQNPVYTFKTPGNFDVKLEITDRAGCVSVSKVNSYLVREPLATDKADMYAQLTDIYPNPTTGLIRVNWSADVNAGPAPEIWFSDQVGRQFKLPVKNESTKEIVFDFAGIPNGLYIAHFTYKDTNFIKRIVVLR
ncbi:S8 family serine peptidase [Pontibacter sp. KCTC 32443]|uniref:S8 family serine peptidase n=1 Tax=Pontibacter TaxID=323449 RepID=UPI00164E5FB9|nr:MULTISPECIES: S8 family serine peptidase [Pontibacter]MBC5772820.1 S8 family serine peptidase [Pontibacter sp. KCTC 32443]